jgi:ATP-binding cassette subfamily B protein
MAGRTTFIIAHRLSTITLADEILLLENSHVGAHGTHEQLLESSELYREIVEKGLPDGAAAASRARERRVATR